MYGCKSWTIKKSESQRIDAFELWCWRRLLRVPWTERRSNQSISKGNQSWISIGRTDAEITILWPLDVKNWLIRKDPMLGKIERAGDDREWDGWMASLTWWTWAWASSGSLVVDGKPGVLQSMGSQSQTCLSNWTELKRQPSPLCLSNGPTPPNPSLFVPPHVPALSCPPFPT